VGHKRVEDRAAVVAREDLVMFVNACFACTSQREFYGADGQELLSVEFLHRYILGNYRRLYARCLAVGINHFNQSLILLNLLASGSPVDPEQRAEEGELIATALRRLPPQRAYGVLEGLRLRRVNNRRSRAVVRRYLAARRDPTFEAVKYRRKLAAAAAHAHLSLPGELGPFLFELKAQRRFATPLLESYRRARYSKAAVFELPHSVARGFAARQGIEPDELYDKAADRMSGAERLRAQASAGRARTSVAVDLGATPPTRLALYLLSLSRYERQRRIGELRTALIRAAEDVAARVGFGPLGRVAAVLDASGSAAGSRERRNRPLAVALAASALLKAAARQYRAFWTPPHEGPEVLVRAGGQSALAGPILDALAWSPDLLVVVSDGVDNDPPGGAAEVLRVYRQRLDPAGAVEIVHANPVFDAAHFEPRRLCPLVPTVGLRDAEDLPTMLGFARFAVGDVPLEALEDYLARRASALVQGIAP